jgi:hypothetical protein
MAFNKMMIMLPLMFAARKLDGNDPNIVFLLRCSYFTVQFFIVLSSIYIYMTAKKIAANKKLKDLLIYVPPPPSPLADPNAKSQYKQVTFGEHAVATARQLLSSTLMGILMTTGLHWYKGMIVGLAMQSVMGPLNLFDNKLAKGILLGGKTDGSEESIKSRRLFGEKYREELTKDDEIVDAEGKIIVLSKKDLKAAASATAAASSDDKKKSEGVSFEDLLLDTWDDGNKADIGPLLKALNKSNANFKTSENGWTPLMVVAALGAPKCDDAIDTLKQLGANASIVDNEGWNALHWAAFHGSASGAKKILEVFGKNGLENVEDKEGKTPLKHAQDEDNKDVAKVIEEMTGENKTSGLADQEDGIRQRK